MSISLGFSCQQGIALLSLTKIISGQSILQQDVDMKSWSGT